MSTATLSHSTHSLLTRMRAHLETLGELHAHQVRHLDTLGAPQLVSRTHADTELHLDTDFHRAMNEIMFREQSR